MKDKYLDRTHCAERLKQEYEKYNSLVVAFDFDGTVHDYHKEGLEFPQLITLLKTCKQAGFYLTCFTANPDEDYVRSYLLSADIPFDYINETPAFISSKTPMNPKKIYYNILLDDRAGLSEAYYILNELIQSIN